MRFFIGLLIFTIFVNAKEPLIPVVGHLQNSYQPCLTNNGQSIAFLNGNLFAPTINIVNTKDWSYVSRQAPVLDISDKLECGRDHVVVIGKFTRLISTKNASQIDAKIKDPQLKIMAEQLVVGNTLFESDQNSIKVTPIDDFKHSHSITWPKTKSTYSSMRKYSEKTLYMRNVSERAYCFIDVETGDIRDITPQLTGCTYTNLTEDGTYLHGQCYNAENRIFDTKTLKRMPELEYFLSSIKKDKNQSMNVRFFDRHEGLLIIGGAGKFIVWDMKIQKPKYVIEIPYSTPSFDHQNGTVLVSGGADQPYVLLDLKSGQMRYQPTAYNKPHGVFIQNGTPKVVLNKGPMSVGIWNLLEHKWEQRFEDDPFFKDFEQALVSEGNIFFTRGYWKGGDPIRQYSLKSGKLLHTYQTDRHLNSPKAIAVDAVHKKLMVYYNNIEHFGFKIFDMTSGVLLHNLQSPQKHPRVKSMMLSKDGKKLIVGTGRSKGHVSSEVGPSYSFKNEPEMFTWDLRTAKLIVEPCKKRCKSLPRLQYLYAKGDGFTTWWDYKRRSMVVAKDDPYRQIYMYMPYRTSEWIDMDNFGNFDMSDNGEEYLYMCGDNKCRHLNESDKQHFRQPKLLESYFFGD